MKFWQKGISVFGGLALSALFLLSPTYAQERNKLDGWCEQGNKQVTFSGITSTTKVQQSYPSCTVTVFDPGTSNLSTIYADSGGTPKANPFTADVNGQWFFYGIPGRYDVQFSGTGLSTFTRGNLPIPSVNNAGITGSGTSGKVTKFTGTSTIGDSIVTETSSLWTIAGSFDSGTNNLRFQIANQTPTGTVVNRLAVLTGAPSTAINAAPGTTGGVIGIVVAGAGTTGSASVAYAGRASCAFDGATTAGQYVIPSATTAGACNATSTVPLGYTAVGIVLSTNVGSGLYEVLLFGADSRIASFSASSGNLLWNNNNVITGVSNSVVTTNSEILLVPTARTGSGPSTTRVFAFRSPADTSLTADTEAILMQFGGNSTASTVTRQWSQGGGVFSTQREYLFVAPTYAFTSADTISDACTLCITGAPAAGTNATITRAYTIWAAGSGYNRFDGDLVDGATLSTRIDIDASAFNSFPSMDVWLNATNPGRVRLAQTDVFGTRDVFVQPISDSAGGWAVFEGTNAGVILGTFGTTNPVRFMVNRTEVGRFQTGTEFYIGNGIQVGSPATGKLRTSSANGTNVSGGSLEIIPGLGTGTGSQGDLFRRYVLTTASGTGAQSASASTYPIGSNMCVDEPGVHFDTTVAETNLFTTCDNGVSTIEANMPKAGQSYILHLYGRIGTTGTPTIQLRIKVGGTTIADTGANTLTVGTTGAWRADVPIYVRGVGAAATWAANNVALFTRNGTGTPQMFTASGAATVNTTIANDIRATMQWGTSSASNSIDSDYVTIDIVR